MAKKKYSPERDIKRILAGIGEINKRQNILMDGHTYLVGIVRNLSLIKFIKNCFKRGK